MGILDQTILRYSHSPAEIMCEMGEVTLMERKPAMQIKKPKTPCHAGAEAGGSVRMREHCLFERQR